MKKQRTTREASPDSEALAQPRALLPTPSDRPGDVQAHRHPPAQTRGVVQWFTLLASESAFKQVTSAHQGRVVRVSTSAYEKKPVRPGSCRGIHTGPWPIPSRLHEIPAVRLHGRVQRPCIGERLRNGRYSSAPCQKNQGDERAPPHLVAVVASKHEEEPLPNKRENVRVACPGTGPLHHLFEPAMHAQQAEARKVARIHTPVPLGASVVSRQGPTRRGHRWQGQRDRFPPAVKRWRSGANAWTGSEDAAGRHTCTTTMLPTAAAA